MGCRDALTAPEVGGPVPGDGLGKEVYSAFVSGNRRLAAERTIQVPVNGTGNLEESWAKM